MPTTTKYWDGSQDAIDGDAARLRAARKAMGYTQAEVARLAGCSASLVGQIERGQYPVTITFWRSVAHHLGLSND